MRTPIFILCLSLSAASTAAQAAGGTLTSSKTPGKKAKPVPSKPAKKPSKTAPAASSEAPDPEIESLSRALDALAAAHFQEALNAVDQIKAAQPDLLADYRSWMRARALFALGRREEARTAISGIAKEPSDPVPCKPACRHPLYPDLRELYSRTLEATPKKAAAVLAELPPDGRLWSRAAELYRIAQDSKNAEAIEGRLLVEAADAPEAKALATTLGADGVKQRLPGFDKRKARIVKLLDTHDNESAKAEAEALAGELPKKHPFLCELLYVEGKADRKMRQYAAAVEVLNKAKKECARLAKDPKPAPKSKTTSTAWAVIREAAENFELRSALLETEVRSIRGDVEGARKVALSIADGHPKHSFADDALFFLAELLEQRAQPDQAKIFYQRILDEHGDGDLAAEAGWRLAFAAIKDGQTEAAKKQLNALLSGPAGGTIEGARARYWLARLSEGGTGPEACKAYEGATLKPALTFYAWLAVDRLNRKDPGCAAKLKTKLIELRDAGRTSSTSVGAPRPEALAIEASNAYLRARRLALIPGFAVYASLELGLLRHERMNESELVALALAFDGIGDHREAQLILRNRAQSSLALFPEGSTGEVWRAAYSRPFSEEVEKAAEEQKIDPWLLFALAREESTFDPAVISWAGAVGLAQLMPATAQGAYADLGLGHLDLTKLTDPALNLRLGARVLKDGLRYFASSVPLALAAYNGGIGLADKNLPSDAIDFDRWVESIAVKETRKYVKRVIQTYGIYRFLYDDAPFIALPETVHPKGWRPPH